MKRISIVLIIIASILLIGCDQKARRRAQQDLLYHEEQMEILRHQNKIQTMMTQEEENRKMQVIINDHKSKESANSRKFMFNSLLVISPLTLIGVCYYFWLKKQAVIELRQTELATVLNSLPVSDRRVLVERFIGNNNGPPSNPRILS